jgi:hypothetical protein
MKNKVRHVLGISGGKDSTALAIYLKTKFPDLANQVEYYFADTGKELPETYQLLDELQSFLGKQIVRLEANSSHKNAFDHYLDVYNGYLPSSMARWCTKKLKLEPFESWVGNDQVLSYVGIRGDEDREGYISTKQNIQSIFPFRRNIWSLEIINLVMHNSSIEKFFEVYLKFSPPGLTDRYNEIILTPQSKKYLLSQKLNDLLNISVSTFNKVVFDFLKDKEYPISKLKEYSLLEKEESIDLNGVYQLFKENGVKTPGYYDEIEYEVDGEKGTYKRSRSGCYFCFYQRKIEWIWLYERHPDLFKLAQEYEKDGYTWMDNESLNDIIQPKRMAEIKQENISKIKRMLSIPKSNKLIDTLLNDEELCANCFI